MKALSRATYEGAPLFTHGYNMKKFLSLFLTLYFVCAFAIPHTAQAHPHVFIDSSLRLNFSKNTLKCIDVVWTFDDMSSDMFLIDLDTNGDGTLTQKEWEEQRQEIEEYLAEQSFFVHVILDGKLINLQKLENFVAVFENRTLKYKMTIPMNLAGSNSSQKMQIAIFDPTYYTDFYTAIEAVTVTGKKDLKLSIDDAPELAFYQGQIIPTAVTFEF